MSRPFSSARLKVKRAYYHLDCLEQEISLFNVDKAYPISIEFNPDRTECGFYVTVSKPLPQSEWGLIVGDCIHNARAALDHVMWELSESFSGPDPKDTTTQFPILFAKPSTFPTFRVERLPVCAQALVEQLQPYHATRPMEHPLWFCRNLDDTDKHKLIPIIAAAMQYAGFALPVNHPPVVEWRTRYGPFESSAQISVAKFASPLSSEMQVHPDFTVVIALGNELPPYIDIGHRLRVIINHVTRIIDVFESFPNHHVFLRILAP